MTHVTIRTSKIRALPVQQTVYCKCGESLRVRGTDIAPVIQKWRSYHQGEEHGACQRSECLKIRAKITATREIPLGEHP